MGLFGKKETKYIPEERLEIVEKKGISLFFELFKRKFWNYVKLNMLYFITSIPSFLIYWVVLASFIVPVILNVIPEGSWKIWSDSLEGMPVDMLISSAAFFISTVSALILVAIFGGGVFSAGYNYILRNYVRQENAFLLSDYFGITKKNFFQALIVSIIDKIIVCLTLFSAAYYYAMMVSGQGMGAALSFALMILVFLIYAAMHIYLWTILVTFKVSLKQLYKNSFLLVFGTAVRSVCYMLGVIAFIALMVVIFAYMWIASIALFAVIAMASFNLVGHIVSYPIIKKYLIDNNNEKQEGNDN